MSHTGTTGYGEKSYWDDRYSNGDEKYDWYLAWPQFKHQVLPFINVKDGPLGPVDASSPEQISTPVLTTSSSSSSSSSSLPSSPARDRATVKVLIVGCGNSELSKHMFEDGFSDIVSIDYSDVVIQKMKKLYRNYASSFVFESMDVRELKFSDQTFDLIIDKGTLDAILCGNESSKNSSAMLSECRRVLKKGGYFFCITYGQPQSRLTYLEKQKYNWSVGYQITGKTRYMYVMKAL